MEYFWTEVYPETGITIDHTENRTGKIAATGFGLAAICIGAERGWLPREEVYRRVLLTLNSFWDDPEDPDDPYVDGQFGLFWHFVDGRTGRMKPLDCVAMCDSADFIAGVVVAGEYFKGTEVEHLARKIYDRVEWDRAVTRKPDGRPGLLSFGWVPKHVSHSYYETDGLLNFNMSGFADNSLLIYALALGSDTHPIPQETWEEYVRSYLLDEYAGYECVFAGQLFCRQVPHAFIRFSRKRDRKIDYFLDTVNALLADREFNMRVNGYPPQLWGLTDCFGRDSYTHSAPPGPIVNDGTIGTTAFAGALPHIPGLAMEAIRYVRETFGDRVYGRYGFTSSVNLKTGFVSPLYVGIELGPMALLIENYRSGLIWNLFSRSQVMKNFVKRANMVGVVDDFELPPEAPPYAVWTALQGAVSAATNDPQHGRRCLGLATSNGAFDVQAQLTQNDLLDFHFGEYLSIATRDLDLTECVATVGGRETPMTPVCEMPCGSWVHRYYRFPPHEPGDAFCALRLRGRTTGSHPALDNIVLEPTAPEGRPEPVRELYAEAGPIPETVVLRWRAPRPGRGDAVAEYLVKAVEEGRARVAAIVPATAAPGEWQEHMLRFGEGASGCFTMTARDQRGHWGKESEPVCAAAAPGRLDPVLYSAKRRGLQGWSSWSSNIQLRVDWVGQVPALRADYRKTHGWLLFSLDVSPQMASLHSYLLVQWRGQHALLPKLWSADELQADLTLMKADPDADWTTTRVDMQAGLVHPARDPIRRVLFFPAPGDWAATGTVWIAEIRFAD